MKKLWCAVALAAASVTIAGPAQAQTKKELVQKLLVQQQPGIEGLARGLAGQTANQVMQAASEGLQRVPPDKREAAAKAIEADIKKFYDESEPILRSSAVKLAPAAIGAVMEEKFTEDELKQLLAWFESPVNKKYQQLGPEMQNSLTQKLVADTKPTIEPKLRALEQSISKQLGAPAKPAAAPAASAASKPAAKPKN